jgi:hypothetical protein
MAGVAKFARSRAYLHLLQCRMHATAKSHACCGVVRDCCCDVSALRGAVFEFSAPRCHRQIRPIACTSWDVELSELSVDVGGSTAKPPSCESKPTAPNGKMS